MERPFPTPGPREKMETACLLPAEAARALAFPFRLLFTPPGREETQALLQSGRDEAPLPPPPRPAFAPPVPEDRKPRIFLSVGDVSGEAHTLDLLERTAASGLEAQWIGLGGKTMERAGVRLLADLTSRPVMGFGPALARIPFYMGVIARTLALFRRDPPDLAVLVDSPALNLLLGQKARRMGIPVLYYVCPQLWAWAPWRMKRFQRACDGALTLFPFEAPFFRRGGIHAAWAGHPLARKVKKLLDPPGKENPFRDPPTLALLPGSRPRDQEGNLPLMVAALGILRRQGRKIRAVVGQDDPGRLEKARRILASLPGGEEIETTGDLHGLLAGARLAVVKSGTGSLEAALAGTPNLVVYALSPFLRFLGNRFLSVPWVAAANLSAGKEIVPELLLVPGEEEALARATARLWDDPAERERQKKDLLEIRKRLLPSGREADPAAWIRSLLGRGAADPGR